MDVGLLHAAVNPIATGSVPVEVIESLPAAAKAEVDPLLAAYGRLTGMEPPEPPTPVALVHELSRLMVNAAVAGRQVDVAKEAGRLIAGFDAATAVAVAHRAAVNDLAVVVRQAVVDATPVACEEWTARVEVIAGEVSALLDRGAVRDEAIAIRRGDDAVQDWRALDALLAEYDRIRSAWLELRWLSTGNDESRWWVSGGFKGRTQSDLSDLEAAMQRTGHLLIAGLELGWTPWLPTVEQQHASELAATERRKAERERRRAA